MVKEPCRLLYLTPLIPRIEDQIEKANVAERGQIVIAKR
jgi:hypothetical protein